ncbi:MAG: hypothetical protein ABSB19_11350 [Methylomonas sp.]|jgi:hypothetical protein
MDNSTVNFQNSETGQQPCDHAHLIQELAYGGATGNFICIECGRLIQPGIKQQAQPEAAPLYISKRPALNSFRIYG